jgi:hypothetical protein
MFQPVRTPLKKVNVGAWAALAPSVLAARLDVAKEPVKPELIVPVKPTPTTVSSKETVP